MSEMLSQSCEDMEYRVLRLDVEYKRAVTRCFARVQFRKRMVIAY